MGAWHGWIDGRPAMLEEYRVAEFATEAEACAEAEARGGVRRGSRMTGILYAGPGGLRFRVLSTGYASGYTLWGVREQRQVSA